jgi:molecular chaperone DnaK
LIKPNAKIPYYVKKTYSLVSANQTQVEIKLYADTKGTARLPIEAEDTGIVCRIENIPIAPNNIPYPVEVEFSHNANGVIDLNASIPALGIKAEVTRNRSDRYMDDQELDDTRRRLDESWKKDEVEKNCLMYVDKAENFIQSGKDAKGKSISEQTILKLVTTLKSALSSSSNINIDEVSLELSTLVFDLENL